MLKQVFIELTSIYSDEVTALKYWNEIIINYNDAGRYYHNSNHLNNMYKDLFEVRYEVDDWDIILFSLFYHDIMYNVSRSDNEAESAYIAKCRLQSIAIIEKRIRRCILHILATRTHSISKDNDTNLFTDANFSILGQDNDTYIKYVEEIRQEFFIYSDQAYNEGRKKVLEYLLSKDKIFKTDHFYHKYEIQARYNIKKELSFIK